MQKQSDERYHNFSENLTAIPYKPKIPEFSGLNLINVIKYYEIIHFNGWLRNGIYPTKVPQVQLKTPAKRLKHVQQWHK